jgi:hypothetical protein
MSAPRYWVGVASREHVRRGIDGGFCQLCHGKESAASRLRPGDWIVYYSPSEKMRAGEPIQAFTAAGQVADAAPTQVDMGGGFRPWRRRIEWQLTSEAPIRPLIGDLAFIRDKQRWGGVFRFGLLSISAADFGMIAKAMAMEGAGHEERTHRQGRSHPAHDRQELNRLARSG